MGNRIQIFQRFINGRNEINQEAALNHERAKLRKKNSCKWEK